MIPTRLGSTRFPGKALAAETGQPLILHVVDRARAARSVERVIVTAPDPEIIKIAQDAGVEAIETSFNHPNGTSRLAEVSEQLGDELPRDAILVNVQGDEPFLSTSDLKMLMSNVEEDPSCEIATMGWLNHDANEFKDPNIVKVVVAKNDQALFFSRSPIPYDRRADHRNKEFLQHLGVYAFQAKSLAQFCKLSEGSLESIEKLEQLRALEHGMSIKLVRASCRSLGIDTQSDLEAAREKISNPM